MDAAVSMATRPYKNERERERERERENGRPTAVPVRYSTISFLIRLMLMKSPYTDFSSVFFFIRVCINKEREREGEREK